MNTKKVMTHIVAGYPTMNKCEEVAMMMARMGVSFIEIQIPFSDPVADGPVIMKANQAALEGGIKVADSFKLMERLRKKFDSEGLKTELLFMSYFNVLHKYGVADFCSKAALCGAYGLIIPDIPLDEEKFDHYLEHCKKNKLSAIQIVSPLTTNERLRKIADAASGFVYCVSRFGVTGAGNSVNPKLKEYLDRVKKHIKLPLAVGFGIANRSQVRAVHKHAEIAVMGSAIINILNSGKSVEVELKKLLS